MFRITPCRYMLKPSLCMAVPTFLQHLSSPTPPAFFYLFKASTTATANLLSLNLTTICVPTSCTRLHILLHL
jgi:hypothetical protein